LFEPFILKYDSFETFDTMNIPRVVRDYRGFRGFRMHLPTSKDSILPNILKAHHDHRDEHNRCFVWSSFVNVIQPLGEAFLSVFVLSLYTPPEGRGKHDMLKSIS